jgi:glycosyltransferase involved in cell wall biosynthesis
MESPSQTVPAQTERNTGPAIEDVNLHLYLSTFEFDSRIQKETATIRATELFDRIIFLGVWRDGLPLTEELETGETVIRVRSSIHRFRVRLLKAFGYFEYWRSAFRAVRGKKLKLVHAHALNVLLIAVSLKIFKGCRILYDPHELETESNGLHGLHKRMHKAMEWALIRFVDSTQVVGEEIALWYRQKYNLSNIFVVRNIPRVRQGVPRPETNRYFRDRYEISDEALVFLYQGFLNRGRGIDLLLEAFRKNSTHHIVFMGYGPLAERIKGAAESSRNIHFHAAVPPAELPAYTSAADVGLSLIENTCLSYYYCLPNKVFEYIHAGVPVIASDFPEMRRLVQKVNCGWLVDVNAGALEKLLNSLSRRQVLEMRENVLAARDQVGWHTEEPALLEALNTALKDAA